MGKGAVTAKLKAEGACRLCRRDARVRPLTRHRIVPGRYRGRYTPPNCVPLCRPCHELVDGWNRLEGPMVTAERRSARRMLRAALWPVEVAYAIANWPVGQPGELLTFDDLYPIPTRELVERSRTWSTNDRPAAYAGPLRRPARRLASPVVTPSTSPA